ncbi:MAG: B-box zinc finger protein [Anaerolineae bacterium]|nr:B-box zinc finger protein [Anaerolineae bacterium]
MAEQVSTEEITYCAVHPDRETGLRCNKCGRLMCAECAVQTPVGYRCRECVRAHDDKFFKGTTADYGIVFAVAVVIAALGMVGLSFIGGFLLFVIILAIPIGGAVSEVALRLTGRRRGRYSGYVAAAGALIGALAPGLILYGQLVLSLTVIVYAALVAITAYGRFRLSI